MMCVCVHVCMHIKGQCDIQCGLCAYLLYGSGAGEVEVVVPLSLTVADDQQEVLV